MSDHENSLGGFERSAKVRDKLEQLAQWRIEPSAIKFLKEAPEFEGGQATVSRALLAISSNCEDWGGQSSDDAKDEAVGLKGRIAKSNLHASRSADDSDLKMEKDGTKRPSTKMKINAGSRGGNLMMKLLATRPLGLLGKWLSSSSNPTYNAVAVKKMRVSGDIERVLQISHPNIIQLNGFVEDVSKNMIWLVFPWEANGSLSDFIASANWEIPERISLINDVAGGVKYLHSQKPAICHGDLKSANVLVNSENRAVITDFGSARRLTFKAGEKRRGKIENTLQAGLVLNVTFCTSTMTMSLTGNKYTLRWAAPELLNGDEAGLQSDIWALGWVAYEVMTNSIPFQDVGNGVVVNKVIQGDLPSFTADTRMLLIQALASLMIKCLTVDPSKRPTAEEYQKSINWMPKIVPSRARTQDAAWSADHSPDLLMQQGYMHRMQNDYPSASKYHAKALIIYTDNADRPGMGNARVELAGVHKLQNQYNQAVISYSEALKIYTGIGDRRGRAAALWGLADVHRLQREYGQALTFYSESLKIRTEIGDIQGRAEALWGLADVHRHRNEHDQAFMFYSECLQIRTDVGHRLGRADALFGLAEVHRSRKEYNQAVTHYCECLQIWTDVGNRPGRADALFGLAEVHLALKDYSHAFDLYSYCLQISTDMDDRDGRAQALKALADVHRLQMEYSHAIELYSDALTIFTDNGNRYWRALTLRGIAGVHQDQNNYSRAIHHYEEAAKIYTEIGDKNEEAIVLNRAAEVRRSMEQRAA